MLASCRSEPVKVSCQFEQAMLRLLSTRNLRATSTHEVDDIVGPLFELIAILPRNAEDVRNHNSRERISKIANDIHLWCFFKFCKQVVYYAVNPLAHTLYHSGSKSFADQGTQPCM